MDKTDHNILNELQADSSRTLSTIADSLGLSLSACHRRVRSLETTGLIKGYGARLDAEKLGLELEVFVEISLASQSSEALDAFEKAILEVDDVLECRLTSGRYDYIIRIVARNITDFQLVHHNKLASLPGVSRMQSFFTLKTIKSMKGFKLPE